MTFVDSSLAWTVGYGLPFKTFNGANYLSRRRVSQSTTLRALGRVRPQESARMPTKFRLSRDRAQAMKSDMIRSCRKATK